MSTEQTTVKKRGFAGMTEERRREIASMGGKRAQELGTSHKFTPEEAREAGRKGGMISKRTKKVEASNG